jgi:hypothetical protein
MTHVVAGDVGPTADVVQLATTVPPVNALYIVAV